MSKSKLRNLLDDKGHLDFDDEERAYFDERRRILNDKAGKTQGQRDRDLELVLPLLKEDRRTPNAHAARSKNDDEDDSDDEVREEGRQVVDQYFSKSTGEQDRSDDEDDSDDDNGDPDNIKYRSAWSDDEDEEDDEKIAMLQQKMNKTEKLRESDFYAQEEGTIRPRTKEEIEQAKEEEEEAMELQKERTERLMDQDFFDDGLLVPRLDKQVAPSHPVETITRIEELTKSEKLKAILKDSPELAELADDCKQKLDCLKNELHPMLIQSKGHRIGTREGINFLEAKFNIILNYCINVLFYLQLKAAGRSVRDHPVIDHLLRSKRMMEQLKPIDIKLNKQYKELLTLAKELPFNPVEGSEYDGSDSASHKNVTKEQESDDDTSETPKIIGSQLHDINDEDDEKDDSEESEEEEVLDFATVQEELEAQKKREEEEEARLIFTKQQLKKKKNHEMDAIASHKPDMSKKEDKHANKQQDKRKRLQHQENSDEERAEERNPKKIRLQREQQDEMFAIDQRDDKGKRQANRSILSNRGLTVNRSKDKKNARLKLRNKFHKKTGIHRSMAARQSERNNYKGERSIDANVVRSKLFQ